MLASLWSKAAIPFNGSTQYSIYCTWYVRESNLQHIYLHVYNDFASFDPPKLKPIVGKWMRNSNENENHLQSIQPHRLTWDVWAGEYVCLCINKIYSLDVHWNMHVRKSTGAHRHIFTIEQFTLVHHLWKLTRLSLDRERVCEKKSNERRNRHTHTHTRFIHPSIHWCCTKCMVC